MNLSLFDNTTKPALELLQVQPVMDSSVRGLCVRPYPGHKKGCPNFNEPKHGHRCPPGAPLFDKHFDLSSPVYAVINEFNLVAHMQRMAARNPSWSDQQLRCVLYWQQTARKQLAAKIEAVLATLPGYEATWCPEGMGVNVTATLEQVGIILEWPPQQIARQVALLGRPKSEQITYRWLGNGEQMLSGDEFATRSTSGERYKPDDPNDIVAVWRPIPADNIGVAYNPYEFIAVRRIVNE